MSPAINYDSMLAPLGVNPVVLDTSGLINDVIRRCRYPRPTALLEAAADHSARLLAAHHVARELAKRLPGLAVERGVRAIDALTVWNTYYAPVVWFVDVPDAMPGAHAASVAARDLTDLPTALLAELVGAAVIVTEDADLLDYGFGTSPWLTAALALRDVGRYQSGMVSVTFGTNLLGFGIHAVASGIARRPMVGLSVAGVAAVALIGATRRGWRPSGRGLRSGIEELGELLTAAHTRYGDAARTLDSITIPDGSEIDPDIRAVASVLARVALLPLPASALAKATSIPNTRFRQVLALPPFVVRPGGWSLGRNLMLRARAS